MRQQTDPYAAEDRQRAQSDLEAQWEMAEWTKIMAVAAIVALTLSFIGVGLVFVTFRATQKAANASASTLRAFIDLERPRLVPIPHSIYPEKDGAVVISVHAENIGKSTAYTDAIVWQVGSDNNTPTQFPLVAVAKESLHPQEKKRVTYLVIPKELSGQSHVSGYVEYRSPFRPSHRAYFCFRIDLRTRDDGLTTHGPYVTDDKPNNWPEDT